MIVMDFWRFGLWQGNEEGKGRGGKDTFGGRSVKRLVCLNLSKNSIAIGQS